MLLAFCLNTICIGPLSLINLVRHDAFFGCLIILIVEIHSALQFFDCTPLWIPPQTELWLWVVTWHSAAMKTLKNFTLRTQTPCVFESLEPWNYLTLWAGNWMSCIVNSRSLVVFWWIFRVYSAFVWGGLAKRFENVPGRESARWLGNNHDLQFVIWFPLMKSRSWVVFEWSLQ